MAYRFDAKNLVRGLFDPNTDEAALLEAAASGEVELYSSRNAWNNVLWLISNILVKDGSMMYSGEELGELKRSLPIKWKD